MWARVSRYQFPATRAGEIVEHFNRAVDAFSEQPGLRRADVLVNRKSGAGITITVWESEESMRASEDDADRWRSGIALELAGWVQAIEEYELARSEPFPSTS
jgi:heme-degrading monooxygenase HmoA